MTQCAWDEGSDYEHEAEPQGCVTVVLWLSGAVAGAAFLWCLTRLL